MTANFTPLFITRFKTIFLSLPCLFLSTNIWAEDGDTMYFTNTDGVAYYLIVTSEQEKTASAEVTDDTPYSEERFSYDNVTELTLPLQYNGYRITSVRGCNIVRNLQKLVIPEGYVKIEQDAFSNLSQLTDISLPSSLEVIEGGCFSECSSLETVTIPENARAEQSWNKSSFYNCQNLKKVILNCKDASSFINYTDFYRTVKELHFGKTVEKVLEGDNFGLLCLKVLDKITVDPENPLWDSRENCNALIRKSDNRLVMSSNNTVIPNSVKIIGVSAFIERQLPENFVIPDGVEEIRGYAFARTNLKTITIPESLTFIGNQAFSNCQELEQFTLLAEGCSIQDYAFENCSSLKSIDFPAHTNVAWDGNAFSECLALESLTFAPGCLVGGLNGLPNLKTVKFADCPWHYDEESDVFMQDDPYRIKGSFYSCSNLKEIKFGEGGDIGGFSGMENLETISIPKGCSLSDYCFSDCINLKEVILPKEFLGFGGGCFSGCSSLKDIKIPESVAYIPSNCFQNCTSLESLTLPASIVELGTTVIWGCNNLKTVISYVQEPFNTRYSLWTHFDYSTGNTTYPSTLYVPYGTKASYEMISEWNQFGQIIEMEPTGIKETTMTPESGLVIFSPSGLRLPEMKKGINIVNGRKVMQSK